MPIPDDMLYYYNTDGNTHYFSVYYSITRNEIRIVEIEMEDFWGLVKEGDLQLKEVSPSDFIYKIPGNILGAVKVFII
jgi:hypothetical protein